MLSRNNTAELTAIGEACHWLSQVCCNERYPHHPKEATICYDSEYAFQLATRLAAPRTNAVLAESVATLVTSVRLKIALSFRHVRGHTGIHGNEVADQLADRGAAGRVSPHFVRWTQPPEGPMGGGALLPRGPKPKPAPKVRLRRPAAAPGIGNAELIPIADRPGYFLCDSCNQGFRRGDLPQHRPDCRGPEPANRTCKFCNKVLGSIQARRNHERYTHPQEALNAGLIGQIPRRCQ